MKLGRAIAGLTLAAALAAGGAAGAQPGPPTVITVQLSDYRYSPATIELTRGQSYVLRLANSGRHGHDLAAKAFFQTVSLDPAAAPKVRDGNVEVDKGVSTDIALTPNKAGSYEMHCTHPMHSMLGMKGQIIVH
jgi:plastocyanin